MFRAAAESTNLYGSESWTLTSEIYKKLGVVYTTFLKPILRISWWDRRANKGLYVNPKLTDTNKQQRMSFAGHCWRSKELAHDLIFWEPSHGKRRKERPAETFIRQLEEDTSRNRCDITKLIEDCINWKIFFMLSRVNYE